MDQRVSSGFFGGPAFYEAAVLFVGSSGGLVGSAVLGRFGQVAGVVDHESALAHFPWQNVGACEFVHCAVVGSAGFSIHFTSDQTDDSALNFVPCSD